MENTSHRAESGLEDHDATDLFVEVYDELRRMAHAIFDERVDHTLQPTAVLHEAYVRLAGRGRRWKNRAHFIGSAVRAMKLVLIDHARRNKADKRGGGWLRITLDDGVRDEGCHIVSLLILDEALSRLRAIDPERADIADLRLFGGLGNDEIASMLGVSRRTVQRQWRGARAFLAAELK